MLILKTEMIALMNHPAEKSANKKRLLKSFNDENFIFTFWKFFNKPERPNTILMFGQVPDEYQNRNSLMSMAKNLMKPNST